VSQPRNFAKTNLNKDFQPRMPWHDIAVQIRGDVVIDLLRHFVQYWYFVKSELTLDPRKIYNILEKRLIKADSYGQNM
jgi:phospholipase D1/2